jgi:hypothetical protein
VALFGRPGRFGIVDGGYLTVALTVMGAIPGD